MRDRDDPAVARHLQAENDFTERSLAHLAPLRAELETEMRGRVAWDAIDTGWVKDAWRYYQRSEPGRAHSLYCRQPIDGGAEQVLFDPNALAGENGYVAVGGFHVSDDGRRVAYTFDPVGDRRWALHVRDLQEDRLIYPEQKGVGDVVWMADGQSLLLTRQEHGAAPWSLWLMRPGEPPRLLHEEMDERFVLHLDLTRSGAVAILTSASLTASEVRIIRRDDPQAGITLVEPRREGIEYFVDHHADRLLIRTNDTGPGFRLVEAPVDAPGQEHWREIVPARDGVALTFFEPFASHVVLHERIEGLPRLRALDVSTGCIKDIPLPDGWVTIRSVGNTDFGSGHYRFSYESTVVPPTLVEYSFDIGRIEVVHRTEVEGGYDSRDYAMRVLHAQSADGTRVPVTIAYRTTGQAPGPRAVLLRAYGAYGLSEDPFFSLAHASLLDRGVILATAHVRGGGEKGRAWHDGGRLHNKPRGVDDFLAAAQCLIEQGIADASRIVVHGVSAGGALVTAAMNHRPELFAGVLAEVPFVDVLNTMLDPALPLVQRDYEEWGDPRQAADYFAIKRWCPYTNLRPRPYPPVLVTGAMHDSQVMYWEPAKFVARLRGVTTSGQTVLLRVDQTSGHDGPSSSDAWIEHQAFLLAWVLDRCGFFNGRDKTP